MGNAAQQLDNETQGPAIVVLRLQSWARWLEGSRTGASLGYGGCTIAAVLDCGGQFIRSTAPGRADDMPEAIYNVERAVNQLDSKLKQIVIEHYRHADAPEDKRLAVCGISRATYYRRLNQAHTHVMMLLVPLRKPANTSARDRILARINRVPA